MKETRNFGLLQILKVKNVYWDIWRWLNTIWIHLEPLSTINIGKWILQERIARSKVIYIFNPEIKWKIRTEYFT